MTAAIPTREPERLMVGDTWRWRRELSSYPASLWTLTYYVRGPNGEFTIAADSDGDTHDITVAMATTAVYHAGDYTWAALVSNGTERYWIANGALRLLVDPAQIGKGYDPRVQARQIHDALRVAYQAYVEAGALRQSYTIAGRQMVFRDGAELLEELNYWSKEAIKEENAEGIGNRGAPRVVTRL